MINNYKNILKDNNDIKARYDSLKNEIKNLNENIEEYEKDIKNKEQIIIDLKEENSNYKLNIEEKISKKDIELSLKADEYKKEIKNKNENLQKLSKEILNKVQIINNLNKEIMNYKNEIKNKNTQISSKEKEFEKLNNQIESKNEEINKLNSKIKQNIFLQKDFDKATKELHELEHENDVLNTKIEDQEKQINQYKTDYNNEKNKNSEIMKKNESLETKIDLLNADILELTKAKTFKIPSLPPMEDDEFEKFSLKKKYSMRFRERKDSEKNNKGEFTSNNESTTTFIQIDSKEKKVEEEKNNNDNQENEIELIPDNYELIKIIKLKNNFKWFLFKKLKSKLKSALKEKDINQKPLSRRFRCFSHRKFESENINNQSNDSYSNYIWKPQKNRTDFADFCLNARETTEEKQKKN